MKLSKLLTIMLLLLSSANALAAGRWVQNVKVRNLVVVNSGGVNVRVTPDLSGCTSQSGYGAKYASLMTTHPGIERIHAVLLSAYMADKTVSLWLSDEACTIGEIKLGGY